MNSCIDKVRQTFTSSNVLEISIENVVAESRLAKLLKNLSARWDDWIVEKGN